MAAFGIAAFHSSSNRSHVFGHAASPTARIFEIWKGASNSANPFWVDGDGDVMAAPIANPSIGTTATDGFFWIRSANGAPTGTPSNAITGRVPLVYDYANHELYAYHGSWRSVALT